MFKSGVLIADGRRMHFLAKSLLCCFLPLILLLWAGTAEAIITATQLTSGTDNTTGPSFTTASITPGANRLILAWVAAQENTNPVTPTLSGNGLTWVRIGSTVDYCTIGNPKRNLTLFRAMGAAPTAGSVTISFSKDHNRVAWSIEEYAGVVTTGTNGSGAIVQSASNAIDSYSGIFSVTLPSSVTSGNATVGGFATDSSPPAFTAGTGFTAFTEQGGNGPTMALRSEWKVFGGTTSVPIDVINGDYAGIAVELQAVPYIHGRVFEDFAFAGTAADWDGGANHKGMANVDVELYSNANAYIASTTTAADGTYSFNGLAAATYKVRVRSATVGDADTPPQGGFNACVPGSCAYPIPTMTWGNGSALYGGQSATADDTATADNLGPGNTYVSTTLSGSASQPTVNFGFAYNLIVSKDDDNNNATTRSKAGTLRQFIKNANAIGSAAGTTANYSQFRMQVATNQSSGGDAWWRIAPASALPSMTDSGTTIDGSTQLTNSGTNSNSKGPEIEINGAGAGANIDGLTINNVGSAVIKGLVVNGYTRYGIYLTGAGATANAIYGNYIGTNATGTAAVANAQYGVYVYNGPSNNDIGGPNAGQGNLLSGNTINGVRIEAANNNRIRGNYIGTNASGNGAVANTNNGVYIHSVNGVTIGGATAGEGNLISGNGGDGIAVTNVSSSNITIQGNKVGTDSTGTAKVGNSGSGVSVSNASNTIAIGGSANGASNIISGNSNSGISISGAPFNITIYGNTIGTGVAGNEAGLGNGSDGITDLSSAAAPNIKVGGVNSGEGNLIVNNQGSGVQLANSGVQVEVKGNTIKNSGGYGIYNQNASGVVIAKNLISTTGWFFAADGIYLSAGATGNKIYQNTIHAAGRDGIRVGDTGATIRNNIITGNSGYGINRVAASMTESYNDVTDAATTPANSSGRSNVALDASDLNINPLYTNSGAGDFTLQNASQAINRGIDLVADQPDMNGAIAGLFNGYAPDMGYWESIVTNTCPVTTTADSGAGSLRACITYANANPGTTVSFSIPAGSLTGGVAIISPASNLPAITGAGTVIDGTTQTTNVGDTNAGTQGTGGTVGVDGLILSTVNKPEVEIKGSNANPSTGFVIQANSVTIRGLAMHGFGVTPNSDTNATIFVSGARTGILIEKNFLGTTAVSFADPGSGAGNRSQGDLIRTNGGASSGTIQNNLIGYGEGNGVIIYTGTWTVQNNEVRRCDYGATNQANIGLAQANAIGESIVGNLVTDGDGVGVNLFQTGNNNIIQNNTITGNGLGTSTGTQDQTSGVRIYGNSTSIDRNIITNNYGAGVIMDSVATSNVITKNSIFGNGAVLKRNGAAASGQIGIDLKSGADAANGTAPFYTINDNGDADAGANGLLNYPILSSAMISGGNLVLTGYARPGSAIELFIANGSGNFGQGQTYLTTLTEGSGADTDAGTGTYGPANINGFAQGTDTPNKFTFTIALPGGVSSGTKLTATATLGGNSSEFSGNVTVAGNSISGRVFEDYKFAGTAIDWDGGVNHLGLGNVTVELYSNANAFLATTATAAGGTYSFSNLANGTYKIRVRSTTVGDADTPPEGGLNACVPGTCAYPIPTMTWGNGSALYGGQSATADDTATAAGAGPGNTYVTATVSSADVANVNFGFAYNLIVSADDDSNNATTRSKAGTLRQFIKNANAIGNAGGTTANSAQFHIANALLVAGAAKINVAGGLTLPPLNDASGGTVLDGTTQITSIGDTNAGNPVIVIDGATTTNFTGLLVQTNSNQIRKITVQNFGYQGIELATNSDSNIIQDCIIKSNSRHGILFDGLNDSNQILSSRLESNGGPAASTYRAIYVSSAGGASNNNIFDGNTILSNSYDGIQIEGSTGNIVRNNSIHDNGQNSVDGHGVRISGGGSNQVLNNIIYTNKGHGVLIAAVSTGNTIQGNFIYGNGWGNVDKDGISIDAPAGCSNNIIQMNVIRTNYRFGIVVGSGTNNKIYQNTIHGNGTGGSGDGLYHSPGAGMTTIVKNNILSGNNGYGINYVNGTMTESYNDVTDAATLPANSSGRSNVALNETDLNANPFYINSGAGDFTLQNSSPVINRGVDLAADQPDMNGATAGLFNGFAPEMGYWESPVTNVCPVSTTADSGAGSLRACITYANSNPGTTVNFSLSPTDSGYQTSGSDHWWRFTTVSALPTITASSTIIDGSTQRTLSGVDSNSKGPEIEIFGNGITASGLTVSGASGTTFKELVINSFAGITNNGSGIYVNNATNTTIRDSYLGTNAIGSAALANNYNGITVAGNSSNTLIGGVGTGNIISGNNVRYGIELTGTSTATTIKGNTIGTGFAGTENLPNRTGIMVFTSAATTNNVIGGVYAGEGNVVANSSFEGIYMSTSGTGDAILGNTVRNNGTGGGGIFSKVAGVVIAKNVVFANAEPGINLDSGANNNKVYQNTVNGNTGGTSDGIVVTGTGAIIRNNIFTGNGRYGINRIVAGYTEDHNLVTNALYTPVNAAGDSNVALDISDRPFDPLYINAAGANFALTACQSPAINAGLDLVGSQPDMNDISAGLYNGLRPDMGAFESTCLGNSDITIDGNFNDWTNGTGNELCISDQCGADDWTSPAKEDITKFCIATNNVNTAYILIGFDDTSVPDETPACVLVDTDSPPDGRINFVICATLFAGGPASTTVTLHSCNNSISGGCGNATLVKTYPPASFAVSNSVTGPFGNTDTFVEAAIPFADLGVTAQSVVFTSLASFQTGQFLKKPQDSIFCSSGKQNYDDRIQYDLGSGTGNQNNNPLVPSVAGTVYTNEGVTGIGAGKKITLLVNGTVAGFDTTDASGSYYISASMSAGNAIMVYIDDDATSKGNTVTVFNGANITNLDIYAGHVITRQDNGGALTNANMSSAKGVSADTDILYGVVAGALTVTGSGTKLYVPTGHSFTPGNNVTTPTLKSYGTFSGGTFTDDVNGDLTIAGGSYTATSATTFVQGNFAHSGGTFTANSGTVLLDGTGQTVSGSTTFQNLTKSVAVADTLTFQAGATTSILGTATLNGASGQLLSLRSSTPGTMWNFTMNNGAVKSISFVDVKDSDASGSHSSQKPINPVNSLDSHNNISWFTLYTISGLVFEDANFPGTATDWDGGASDKALRFVELELYDAGNNLISTAVTAADGTFTLNGASNGSYKIRARTATIGDSNTPPSGSFTGVCGLTDPVSGPACATAVMTWGNGSPLYGGQSAAADDTATAKQAGPGNSFVPVAVSGANLTNVNFGFSYNLITNTNDTGPGSLRQFIANANAIGSAGATSANSSQFRIPVTDSGYQTSGSDHWWRIAPTTALPTLTDSGTTINAATQTTNIGDSNSLGPEIEINGAAAPAASNALTITGGTSTIRGLVINAFTGTGIDISTNGSNTIAGNFIGLNATGTSAPTALFDCVKVNGTTNNTIGGTSAADRNVIGGALHNGVSITGAGATGNVVKGNYLGTNATGTAALANESGVTISAGTGNTIGGTAIGAGNLISGSTMFGIALYGNSNTVIGNYIGTNSSGDGAIGNQYGVLISNVTNNTIGGTTAGERNTISGNTGAGVQLTTNAANNTFSGNYIGTKADGTGAVGNRRGFLIWNGAHDNTIGGTAAGKGNIIANSAGGGVNSQGIYLNSAGTIANIISGNSIFSNEGLGIDILPVGAGTGSGANNNKAAPVISAITDNGANFDITVTCVAGDTVEFFRATNAAAPAVVADPSASGEGYLYLGKCMDNGACSGPSISGAVDSNGTGGIIKITLTPPGASVGDSLTATATDAVNGTSEFAVNKLVAATYKPDAMIKLAAEAAGAYLTDNLYEATATVQIKSQGVLSGSVAAYTLQFQNDGNSTDSIVITGSGSGSGFTVQYLDDTASDRTAAVIGAGYTIAGLTAGAGKIWTLNVTPAGTVLGGSVYNTLVTATSATDSTKKDQVKAVTNSTSAHLTLLKNADKATAKPGDEISYSTTASNGSGLTSAGGITLRDPIPANTGFKTGSASFNAGTSTLTATTSYSSNNGASWLYIPVSGGCSAPAGYDYCVTDVRWAMTGTMPTGTSFNVGIVTRVK